MFEAILAKLLSLSGGVVGKIALSGLGIGVLFKLSQKYLPAILGKLVSKQVGKMVSLDNADDRSLVLAIVKWAEAKIPDRGQGRARWELVVQSMSKLIPGLGPYNEQLVSLIEEMVSAMDAELKKQSQP